MKHFKLPRLEHKRASTPKFAVGLSLRDKSLILSEFSCLLVSFYIKRLRI